MAHPPSLKQVFEAFHFKPHVFNLKGVLPFLTTPPSYYKLYKICIHSPQIFPTWKYKYIICLPNISSEPMVFHAGKKKKEKGKRKIKKLCKRPNIHGNLIIEPLKFFSCNISRKTTQIFGGVNKSAKHTFLPISFSSKKNPI